MIPFPSQCGSKRCDVNKIDMGTDALRVSNKSKIEFDWKRDCESRGKNYPKWGEILETFKNKSNRSNGV